MTRSRCLAVLLGVLTTLGVVAAADPASATDEFPNNPYTETDLYCGEEDGYATWRYDLANGGDSSSPVHFLVYVDGVVVRDQWLEVGEHTPTLYAAAPEDTLTTLTVVADGVVLAAPTASIDCLPPTTDVPPPTTEQPPTTTTEPPTTTEQPPPTTTPEPPAEVLSVQAVPTTAAPVPSLPRTGSTTAPLTAAGATSVLVGSALLTIARRRATQNG